MEILTIIMQGLKNSFNFSGRMSRKDYFIFQISITVILTVISAFIISLTVFLLPLVIVFLFCFLPAMFAANVRRLHDSNKSGWWLFLGSSASFSFSITTNSSQSTVSFPPDNIYLQLLSLAGYFYLIYLIFRKGDEGDNDYGPPSIRLDHWEESHEKKGRAGRAQSSPMRSSIPINLKTAKRQERLHKVNLEDSSLPGQPGAKKSNKKEQMKYSDAAYIYQVILHYTEKGAQLDSICEKLMEKGYEEGAVQKAHDYYKKSA